MSPQRPYEVCHHLGCHGLPGSDSISINILSVRCRSVRSPVIKIWDADLRATVTPIVKFVYLLEKVAHGLDSIFPYSYFVR